MSWAGAAPRKDAFCFGSEDGRILVTDLDGVRWNMPDQVSPSREAINGLAFIQPWIGCSTRNEILVRNPETLKESVIPVGAHEVIAGLSGYFFAPLGPDGILFFRPQENNQPCETVSPSMEEGLNFYRLIALRAASGQEIIACAARKGGIATMEFKGEHQQHQLRVQSFNDLDVVDVCSLDLPGEAPIAALGRDGTIILFRDVLQEQKPRALKCQGIKGTAYRIFSTCGQLFILTSEGLYVITNLFEQALRGVAKPVTQVRPLLMEAVDANLANERWVLIVMTDGILRLDADLLRQSTPNGAPLTEVLEMCPTPIDQNWKRREVALDRQG